MWTDGSVGPTNPGPGGWAVVTLNRTLSFGFAHLTTNVRMEGIALLHALQIASGRPCTIYTDSQLWVDSLTKWADRWQDRGWRTSGGKPVANLDLVTAAVSLYRASKADLEWVRGHANDAGNILADEIAGRARLEQIGQHVRG